jgi:hypothetical protein
MYLSRCSLSGCATRLLFLSRHFIPFAGWLSTATPHDLVEGLEVRPRSPILEKPGSLESGDLLGHRRGYELVDARSVLPAQSLDRFLERPR